MLKNLLVLIGLVFAGLAVWPGWTDGAFTQPSSNIKSTCTAHSATDCAAGRFKAGQADRTIVLPPSAAARHETTAARSPAGHARCAGRGGRRANTEAPAQATAAKGLSDEH